MDGILYLIAFGFMIWLGFQFESTQGIATLLLVAIVVIAVVSFLIMANANAKHRDEAERRKNAHLANLADAEAKIVQIVDEHIETLARRRNTLVRRDRYGVVDGAGWNKEVQHFCDKVVRPMLSEVEAQAIADEGMSSVFQRLVEDRVAEHCERTPTGSVLPKDITPSDFEGLCAAVLRENGWNAWTTKGSGDQGADVVGEKNGQTLVVQCKLYTGSVGNKAVQEVIAARLFYDAQHAAVVSKSSFTKAAIELANASDVDMVQFEELADFADRIEAEAPTETPSLRARTTQRSLSGTHSSRPPSSF